MKKRLLILSLAVCTIANAQYTQLTDFTKPVAFAEANGSNPSGSLISDGTFLYGITQEGGLKNLGTIFKIKPDGTGFVKLLDFEGAANGSYPSASLISDGTFLYGMTTHGGTNGVGTIFKIKPDGTGYVKLLDFAGAANGSNPNGSLVSDGTFLYGMTTTGGTNGAGTIFKIKPDGAEFVKLLDFAGAANGSYPYGSLISDGTFLYGMTYMGGTDTVGTIFKIKPDGTGYVKLLDFAGVTNGTYPRGSLVSDGNFLYGMTQQGGTNNLGTTFKIKTDGTGYVKLLDFAGTADGSNPFGSLVFDGTFLYGTTYLGGTNNFGTTFKIKTDGTGFVKLLDFAGAANGRWPNGSLVSDGTSLYGMTSEGGTNNFGITFKIKPDGTGYVKLLDFEGITNGSYPIGSLISDGTFLYGMTVQGGSGTNGVGTIFKIKSDGTEYVKLLDFEGTANGSNPYGSLISDGTFLYGMTYQGGANGIGTIFKIKPDGTGFVKLLDFVGVGNGGTPYGSLVSDGTFLYGMTSQGGTNNLGTIFKIKTDGTGYVKLLDFVGAANGSNPHGSLVFDGTFLYGMTPQGGTNNFGTIFKIKPDGTGYVKLLDFAGTSNGSNPYGSLLSDGNFLYGMTNTGGTAHVGTVFKYKPCTATTFTQSPVICAGQSIAVGSNSYTTSGTYSDTLVAASTCDSIVTTNLIVKNSTSSTQSVTVCNSYLWNGNTYAVSGTYTDTIPNATGCDSVMVLNLTIKNSTSSTQSVTACNSYLWNNNTYTVSGTYMDTICDSVMTLNLTIKNSTSSTRSITACNSYLWNNNTYTVSGIYTDTIANATGCDSLMTLHATINQPEITGQVTYSGGYVAGNAKTFAKLFGYDNNAEMRLIDSVGLSSNGIYTFSQLPALDTSIIYIQADTNIYHNTFGTYYDGTFDWMSATKIIPACPATSANITLVEISPIIGTNTVKGKIVEGQGFGKKEAAGDGIEGVDVGVKKIPGGQLTGVATTDSNGDYEIKNLPDGDYEMYVNIPGLPIISNYTVSLSSNNPEETDVSFKVDSNKIETTATSVATVLNNINGFSVFPNPAKGEVLLIFSSAENRKLQIVNPLGQLFYHSDSSEKTIKINVADLASGIYYVRAITDREEISKCLIITR